MKKTGQVLLLLMITTLVVCCKNEHKQDKVYNRIVDAKKDSLIYDIDTLINVSYVTDNSLIDTNPKDYFLPPLDSTIFIETTKVLISDTTILPPLTLLKVKKIVNSYFTKKGFYVNGNIPKNYGHNEKSLYNKDGDYILNVQFDTAMFVNVNMDNIKDAVAFFEMTPPYGSSHCYGYMSKAVVISKPKGFDLVGLDFISPFYVVDSIKQASINNAYIYGYDYDCPNWVVNRNFRITLQTNK